MTENDKAQSPEVDIAIREIKTFQADDGRKIQVLQKIDNTPSRVGSTARFDVDKDSIFVGIVPFESPLGQHQANFLIDTPTLKEAWIKFDELATPAVNEAAEEIQKYMDKQMEETQPSIITAPAEALEQLDEENPHIEIAQ